LSRAILANPRLAVAVDKSDADRTIKEMVSLGVFDKDRKVTKKGCHVEIPVVRSIPGCNMVLQDESAFYRKSIDIAQALQDLIPKDSLSLLPRGWFILGKVIVVKIHPMLRPYERHIGQALLNFYPRCSTVLSDDGIAGTFREPVRRIIAGCDTKTVHKENGVIFHLDASQVMFSPGNLKERMRMSRMGRDEYVVDMFAGIGYFTIPMAVHSRPQKILAIELNPNAYHYLCKNISQNHVQDIVEPVLGDCARATPKNAADRVLMGMVQITDRYLEYGISALKPGGILHYHQTIPSWRYPDAAICEISDAALKLGRRAEILKCIRVKKYSPGVEHVVVDARIDA